MTEGMKVYGASTTTSLLGRTNYRVFDSLFFKRTHTSIITLMAKRRRKKSSPVLDFDSIEEEFALEGKGLGGPVLESISKSSRDVKTPKKVEKRSEARNAWLISAKKKKGNFEGLGSENISEPMKNEGGVKRRVTKGSKGGGEDEDKEETLETKMRKTRPPATVRILNSIPQPDFVSIRLENVAVTFKNQEVGLNIMLSRIE